MKTPEHRALKGLNVVKKGKCENVYWKYWNHRQIMERWSVLMTDSEGVKSLTKAPLNAPTRVKKKKEQLQAQIQSV